MPPKLSKKQKKAQDFRKKQKDKALSEENAVPEVDIVADQPESTPINDKKRKAPTDHNESNDINEKPKKKNRRPKKKGGNNGEEKKNRYILFVGNLGFNTKTEELAKHFESVGELPTVRLMTDKQTKKQKGFAFIEFQDSLHLSKALAFHHTYFNKRQINVELTAGGGGRSEARKEKLKEKNEKLQQERQKWHKEKVVGGDPASSYQQQPQEQE
ncbi:hypothetical protein BDA99DRAFT_282334 [Phascolomyces articulosus]|uniref:RRM domain-containing protein n=1 Tax=Phascolomyces articulosus TaxID=60185 RepID=A0AAD5KPV9_9FUNG|nr:hypothetical protein BDA99DRAFT_282334 [Phascolomyces articulosus]